MNSTTPSYTYDIVGIGTGPFNLGLAALTQPLVDTGELTAAFFDQRSCFSWHPGMLLEEATIQVPFLADLVTLADPTSPYSFLNYLKCTGRIHRFYIRENFFPLRKEYSAYCSWVDSQLSTTHWNCEVTSVTPAPQELHDKTGARWLVHVNNQPPVAARNVVSGVGTTGFVPEGLRPALKQNSAIHSADYLHFRSALREAPSVTVIGSGQSAAEIYLDLLPEMVDKGKRVDWITRSPRFFPMEYTKLTLEMTSPEYAHYFRQLPTTQRDELNRANRTLYKGISAELIDRIYDILYRLSLTADLADHTYLKAGVAASYSHFDSTRAEHSLILRHEETQTLTTHTTHALVLCTGYAYDRVPSFFEPVREHLLLDTDGRLAVGSAFEVDAQKSLFVLNADEHVHSLNAPDLGMGPWRNSIVLREITSREVYPIERAVAFQSFGGFTS